MTTLPQLSDSIPPGWVVKRLKYVAGLRSGDMISPEAISDAGEFPVYGGNGLRGFTSGFTHDGEFALIGRQGALCGNINYASGRFWASEHAVVVDPQGRADIRWLGELLRSMNLNQYSQSAAQPGLAIDVIANRPIPVPPLSEQRAIAAFLEDSTVPIDRLIGAKQDLLKFISEKRAAVIAEATMRGLDSHSPLRDSGVPWLGQIPSHWHVERAKWLFRERDERSLDGGEDLLTVSHLTGVTLRSEKDVNMFEAESTEGYKLSFPGDLVINTLWAWMGAMGVARRSGIVSPAYNVYSPTEALDPEYIDALVRIPVFAQEVTRYSKGVWSSRLRLYPEGFFEAMLPVPPRQEQAAIVSYIRAAIEKLAKLRNATERTLELFRERRAALISAAVTGQIKVGDTDAR